MKMKIKLDELKTKKKKQQKIRRKANWFDNIKEIPGLKNEWLSNLKYQCKLFLKKMKTKLSSIFKDRINHG